MRGVSDISSSGEAIQHVGVGKIYSGNATKHNLSEWTLISFRDDSFIGPSYCASIYTMNQACELKMCAEVEEMQQYTSNAFRMHDSDGLSLCCYTSGKESCGEVMDPATPLEIGTASVHTVFVCNSYELAGQMRGPHDIATSGKSLRDAQAILPPEFKGTFFISFSCICICTVF